VNTISYTPAILPAENIFHHILVVGSTGSGKTFTVSRIVRGVTEKKLAKTLIIDWHGEYKYLLKPPYRYVVPNEYPVNPLNTNNSGYSETLELLTDVLDLTPPQVYVLEKVLKNKVNRIDLVNLVEILEDTVDESNWMRESRLSLLRKLYPLIRPKYRELFTGESERSISDHSEYTTIVDVSTIKDPIVKRIYTATILKKIFMSPFTRRASTKILVVIEEAQNLVSINNPLRMITSVLAEMRKFNIGLILVSQSPHRLVDDVMVNTNTKIIHSVKSFADLDVIERALYMPSEIQKVIPYLEVGEAVLYTRGLKKPVIIKVE